MDQTTTVSKNGSLLDCNLAEGICVIVPPGMTALKVEGKKFFHQMSGRLPQDAVDSADVSGDIRLKHLLYIDTAEHIIPRIDDMRELVNGILSSFTELGLKNIAMNGIHCDDRPDMSISPEEYQIQFMKEYLAVHPGTFEKISLIDLRGGFNKQQN